MFDSARRQAIVFSNQLQFNSGRVYPMKWITKWNMNTKTQKKDSMKLLDLAYTEEMKINAFHFDFPGIGVARLKHSFYYQFDLNKVYLLN